MRITSKGQVTIPKHIREKLGVQPGDEIGFREDGQAVILEREETPVLVSKGERQLADALEFIAQLRREGRIEPLGMSVDEYMELIRGYSEDADDPGFKRHP